MQEEGKDMGVNPSDAASLENQLKKLVGPGNAHLVDQFERAIRNSEKIEVCAAQLQDRYAEHLDLEITLRRTLEFVLKYIGPTNATILLPGAEGGMITAGFVNKDYDPETYGFIQDQFAQHHNDLNDSSNNNVDLIKTFPFLEGENVLIGWGTDDDGDVLHKFVLFRSSDKQFSGEDRYLFNQVCFLLAAQLQKAVEVHHRLDVS